MAKSLNEFQVRSKKDKENYDPRLVEFADQIEKIVDGSELEHQEHMTEGLFFIRLPWKNHIDLTSQLWALDPSEIAVIAEILTKRYHRKNWEQVYLTAEETGIFRKQLEGYIVFLNQNKPGEYHQGPPTHSFSAR